MNAAIYYPSINFRDKNWVLGASLLWDKIYRIVPEGIECEDHPELKPLIETGDIGAVLRPQYREEVADKVLAEIEESRAAAFVLSDEEDYTRLHLEKLDVKLRTILDEYCHKEQNWYGVPTNFSTHYMCCLAYTMAEKNNLNVISDSSGAWTSESWFRYDGNIEIYNDESCMDSILSVFSIPEISPYNFSTCSSEKIIKLRDKYRDERSLFMNKIIDVYKKFSKIQNPDIANDYIQHEKDEFDRAVKDYRKIISENFTNRLLGSVSVLIPIATTALPLFCNNLIPNSMAQYLPFGGAILAYICYLRQKNNYKVPNESLSYLFSLQNEWKNLSAHDYDNRLFCDMKEFIYD